jgi:hypothetical protein
MREPGLPTRRAVSMLAAAAFLALAPVPASQALPPGGAPDPHSIRLGGAEFDPLVGLPTQAELAPVGHHPAGVRGAYLVQFDRPITGTDRAALVRAGADIEGYVPMMTLEVVMTEAERTAVEALDGVRWVGVYEAGYKVAPSLLARDRGAGASEPIRLVVSLFPGEDAAVLPQLRSLGARIGRVERRRSYVRADALVPAGRIHALARLPLVRRVEAFPVPTPHNDRARQYSGLTAIADDTFTSGLDPSLDGRDESSGFQVKYGHTDGGLWSAHPDFQAGIANGWITFEPGSDQSDASGHGTHTAATLVGDGGASLSVPQVPPGSGTIAPMRWRGVQPQAALHHISFENGYTDGEILERQSQEGAQILSNSWGYSDCVAPGSGPCTDYDSFSAAWDEGIWDADPETPGRQPITAFFAAGNLALESPDGCPFVIGLTGPDLLTAPATAKNVISVGATETDRGCGFGDSDNPGDVYLFSSRGPVDPDASGRGLFKPDVMAVGGSFVLSAERPGTGGSAGNGFDDPSLCSDTGSDYRYEGGTSMANPVAAGVGGVVLQDLVVHRGVGAPKPSLIKALLINGATPLQPTGSCTPGFETDAHVIHQGWGRVNAVASLYGPGGSPGDRHVAFENEVPGHALETGETYPFAVTVGAGEPLRVTLVWTDYPAAPGAGSPLIVNDLDLEVSGPEGVFLGNNFVGTASVPTTVKAVPDRYNVVENVFIPSAAGGTYVIAVHGFQVSQDQLPSSTAVDQPFSLAWTGSVVPACSDGLDNDGDGRIDFDGGLLALGEGDPDLTEPDGGCNGNPDRASEVPYRPCGLGAELPVVLGLLGWLRRRARITGGR